MAGTRVILAAIRELTNPPVRKRRGIGFTANIDEKPEPSLVADPPSAAEPLSNAVRPQSR